MKPVLSWLKSRRVAVLKGGWSRERSISLKTGQAIGASLTRLGVKFSSVDVGPAIEQVLTRKKINFCILALHGTFGEDGGIQSLLDTLKIPYTGSDALSSAVAMDKDLSKKLFLNAGIPTAPWRIVEKKDFQKNPSQVIRSLNIFFGRQKLFVKPSDQGSAIGATRVDSHRQMKKALQACFRVSAIAMVESLVSGREFTVGILGKKPLPVVEIISEHEFYDFHSKYAKGGSKHVVPAPLTSKETKIAQRLSLDAFNALRCRAVGRVDLIRRKDGEFFVLEVNTIPGMTATSLLPDAARAAGLSFDELLLKIVDLSRPGRK